LDDAHTLHLPTMARSRGDFNRPSQRFVAKPREPDAEGRRWIHGPKDDAVHDLIRFVLSRLTVAVLAIGLASAPLYAAVQAKVPVHGPSVHVVETTHAPHGQPDHHHSGASKPYAAGQFCCHPGCIMAVVPVSTNLAQGVPLSEVVPIPPDVTPVPAMLFGIDRPPKRI
jgi:hypothetical protein